MKIKVTRAFCIAGVPQKVGKELDVSDALGNELVGLNKAEKFVAKPAKPKPTDPPEGSDDAGTSGEETK